MNPRSILSWRLRLIPSLIFGLLVAGGTTRATELKWVAGSAKQSQTRYGANASRAIDGKTDGIFANGSVTCTAPDGNRWWQAELQRDSKGNFPVIKSISLSNRTENDLVRARLNNFWLLVSDKDLSGMSLAQAKSSAVWSQYFKVNDSGKRNEIRFFANFQQRNVRGRFVMIYKDSDAILDTDHLSLAEVRASGYFEAIHELTWEAGTAIQRSTSYNASASKAIDGNTDGNFLNGNGSVSHTLPTGNRWWTAKLKAPSIGVDYVKKIQIFNRTDASDAVKSRLNNFWILLSDAPFVTGSGDPLTLDQAKQKALFSKRFLTSGVVGRELDFEFGHGIPAQYVMIYKDSDTIIDTDHLCLAEVRVLGYNVDFGSADVSYTSSGAGAFNKLKWETGSARQSTVGYQCDPNSAIDGLDIRNTGGQALSPVHSLTHSGGGNTHWWQAKLQFPSQVASITVSGRNDVPSSRFRYFWILVSPHDMSGAKTLDEAKAMAAQVYYQGAYSALTGFSVTHGVSSSENAKHEMCQYVMIWSVNGNQPMSLSEVKVAGRHGLGVAEEALFQAARTYHFALFSGNLPATERAQREKDIFGRELSQTERNALAPSEASWRLQKLNNRNIRPAVCLFDANLAVGKVYGRTITDYSTFRPQQMHGAYKNGTVFFNPGIFDMSNDQSREATLTTVTAFHELSHHYDQLLNPVSGLAFGGEGIIATLLLYSEDGLTDADIAGLKDYQDRADLQTADGIVFGAELGFWRNAAIGAGVVIAIPIVAVATIASSGGDLSLATSLSLSAASSLADSTASIEAADVVAEPLAEVFLEGGIEELLSVSEVVDSSSVASVPLVTSDLVLQILGNVEGHFVFNYLDFTIEVPLEGIMSRYGVSSGIHSVYYRSHAVIAMEFEAPAVFRNALLESPIFESPIFADDPLRSVLQSLDEFSSNSDMIDALADYPGLDSAYENFRSQVQASLEQGLP